MNTVFLKKKIQGTDNLDASYVRNRPPRSGCPPDEKRWKTSVTPSASNILVRVYIAVYGRSCFDDNSQLETPRLARSKLQMLLFGYLKHSQIKIITLNSPILTVGIQSMALFKNLLKNLKCLEEHHIRYTFHWLLDFLQSELGNVSKMVTVFNTWHYLKIYFKKCIKLLSRKKLRSNCFKVRVPCIEYAYDFAIP